MDREALWSSGHDESVEVNQRALIDKVLARYSGEFTVFRELLQNSDDAASKAVEIRFETMPQPNAAELPNLPPVPSIDVKKLIHRWTFRNNGLIFRDEDWARLKKIAEGNPDEEKIGAFGVGFYSLFSVTEEPFVKSGDQWMGFYWKDKKDQLFARRGHLPPADQSDPYREWTTFEMELREPSPLPSIFDFIRFLTSSITFMVHLQNVTLWFDKCQLATITKDVGIPKEIVFPKHLKRKSEGGTMNMISVKTRSINITVKTLRLVYNIGTEKTQPPKVVPVPSKPSASSGFFSSLFASITGSSAPAQSSALINTPPLSEPRQEVDPMSNITSHLVLTIFSGEVDVSLTQKMITELHRSTKKNPPSRLKLELIYTGKDEYDASKMDDDVAFEKSGSLFQGLRADLEGSGAARVFIGHSTAQTTGIGGHISGRFIPTVERESIDLVDLNVAVWNKELLWIGGLLSRVAYEVELLHIETLWNGSTEGTSKLDDELRNWLQGRCLHALKFFSFRPSTPSAAVSNLLESAFFSCSSDGYLPILSTAGVKDSRNVRSFDPVYAGFLKELAVIPKEVAQHAPSIIASLRGRGMLKDISFTDVLDELRVRPLPEADMVECLKWRIDLDTEGINPQLLAQLRREFLGAAILIITDESHNERLIPLSNIQTVHIPRNATAMIPLDVPMPAHTLPFSVSKLVKAEALIPMFRWTELIIPMWTENLFSEALLKGNREFNMTLSPTFAEKVLNVLSRAWGSLPKDHQVQIVAILHDKACIPTKFGMKLPKESYFQNANVFSDLPIIEMPKSTPTKGTMEKLLLTLGVKQHVDLEVVFARMIQTGDWDIHDLIRYLVAVEESLTSVEIERLKETVAFLKEEPDTPEAQPGTSKVGIPLKRKYKARDLYEPSPVLRELGVPILAWTATPKWRSTSDEAKFLFKLGLKKYPALKDLLILATNENPQIRSAALRYFFENYTKRYSHYEPEAYPSLAFIPARKADGTAFLGKYTEVFKEQEYTIMGFSVVDPSMLSDWVHKLKLFSAPSVDLIIPILRKSPPRDIATARRWFELLAGRLPDFSTGQLQYLSSLEFVPTTKNTPSSPTSAHPTNQPHALTFVSPNKCYLSKGTDSEGGSQGFHSQLFTFVDFGPGANAFLTACGVRQEPTVDELARMLVADPRKFYELAGGYDQFVSELFNISANFKGVSSTTKTLMKKAPCLVGSRSMSVKDQGKTKRSPKKSSNGDSDEEDEKRLEHDLLLPSQIAVVDDLSSYIMFDNIFTAPQEDTLERLYTNLGSPLISSVVKEEYRPSAEIKDSPRANDMRDLVLERLPLFLHERTPGHGAQSKTSLSYTWLNTPGNFVVVEVTKLILIRTLQFAGNRAVKQQEVSATSSRTGFKGKGAVQLWISGSNQVDLYEVSNSLCRTILEQHKPNDSLLFMTILSTDLRALRRRGFNVDRVLRQQKAKREQELREQEQMAQKRKSDESSLNTFVSSQSSSGLARQDTKSTGLFSSWKRRLSRASSVSSINGGPLLPNLPGSFPGASNDVVKPTQGNGSMPWNQTGGEGITPQKNIERNVRAAIEACRPESDAVIRSQEHRTQVKEAEGEGYCDVTGAVDLVLVTSIGSHRVFISSSIDPDAREAKVESFRPAIERFIKHVLLPLETIYKLSSTSLNVFYDSTGPLTAFNRSGRIFMNVRYYCAWHDEDVQARKTQKALVSWYHTLAHELAHNLVHPHNSEHEFYFSAISEQHMFGLAKMLESKA